MQGIQNPQKNVSANDCHFKVVIPISKYIIIIFYSGWLTSTCLIIALDKALATITA